MALGRRGLIGGLLAAPAIIRTPGLLMPVRPALGWQPTLPVVKRGGLVLAAEFPFEEILHRAAQATFADFRDIGDLIQEATRALTVRLTVDQARVRLPVR